MTGSGIAPIWRKIEEAASARRRGPAMNNSDTARLTASTLSPTPEPRAAFDRISLRRLVLIRWVAVAGQALALLVVHFVLEFPLPLLPAFGVVACSAALNLFFFFYHRSARRLVERLAAYFLGYAFFKVWILLFLSGGIDNTHN